MKQYFVDGSKINDFQSLCDAFAPAVSAPNGYFEINLATFDDCFFGHVPLELPCQFVLENVQHAQESLDAKVLEEQCLILEKSEFYEDWSRETLVLARAGKRTMFDEVVESIQSIPERAHGRQVLLEQTPTWCWRSQKPSVCRLMS